ncbi:glycosyltransferase family 4 protein [Stakelama pacifica]|uniref:Glycosyltransferase involved in cell wall biosynthesis n=1 Tax=Stakelama pacifica TaxID=517720 RepID=A0A4R6FIF1_9SPHN|nr:glycosyltransferase family 4 protein [Stakelama pacifica]MAW99320.1 glycosyl transferase family 1 [Sphingomonas sp.]TDN80274.1 glycosyltransferase involved in cell wall biosynthesis [Stakelama pacifica]GGO97835.1 glycosyl transferase family 1 [Stakelama pacifica]
MTIKILHLFSSFDPGGKEARAVRLMNAFGDAARHTIVSGVPGALGAREGIASGIRYEIAQDPPALTGRPSVKRYEMLARAMAKFDLVLTYNWGAIDGVMAKRVFSGKLPPVIHHEDGFNEDEARRLNPIRNMYRRVALPAAHALVVPSEKLEKVATQYWKVPDGRLHRISNGIDTSLYGKPAKPDAIPGFTKKEGEIVIGTIAGLRPVKYLPLLLRAVGGMAFTVKLVIVGEGPERENILETAELMGLEDDLVMPGFLPDPHRYLGLFDIFALSSKSEQQPISVMEAMAAGLPVVAPPVGDVPKMVAADNAEYLCPNWNAVGLRDRLQVLAKNKRARDQLGKSNQLRARALFDEKAMVAAYARLYGGAIGRPDAFNQG